MMILIGLLVGMGLVVPTIAAMKETRRGGLPRFTSVKALMDDMNAED